jgi:hypothetical protein
VYLTAYIVGYVLVAAYSAALVSFLAVQRDELPFTSFAGLLEDGTYQLGITRGAEATYFSVSSNEFLFDVHGSVHLGNVHVRLRVQLDTHGFICILYSSIFLLYMFRVLFAPIVRSTNCRVQL